ncbi:MAG: 50S ribosomal protein L25 [Acidobacteriota bacterium]
MPEIVLLAERRTELGKNSNRRLRKRGKVPAVVYGAGAEPLSIAIDPKYLWQILRSQTGANTLFFLELDGKRDSKTHLLIHDVQYDPVTDHMLHVDLTRVSMEKEIRVHVPVKIVGTAKGVKMEAGILDFVTREVEILCLPANIPDHIQVDVSELEVGDSLRVEDLSGAEGCRILTEAERTVIVVAAPYEEKVEEVAEAAAEITEPELVSRKDKEEAEGEEEHPPAADSGNQEKK